MPEPVLAAASQVLAHAPGLARHGSKPMRELPKDPEVAAAFLGALRSFDDAVGYAPNQAYLGAMHPREMPQRPHAGRRIEGAQRFARDGELMPELEFLGLLAAADEFDLVKLDAAVAKRAAEALRGHPLAGFLDLERIEAAGGDAEATANEAGALPLHIAADGPDVLAGAIRRAHAEDEALSAEVLLENLACKATGLLALLRLMHDHDIDPHSIPFTIACAEEAVGDRYQRGGGNMAKAIAGTAGLAESSGIDVKDFCAAPIPAIVVAASLVASGVFERVAVVGGGSLPKLGMKFQGHLKNDLPVLEDGIGGCALLITADDGTSPRIRLDAVGRHRVKSGGANPQILTDLAIEPLERVGLKLTDVDDIATEMHDPDVTEPQGSGDVAARNYRTIAALAARRGTIERADIDAFVERHGMPGFAPTQGHLASAVCYAPHAIRRLTEGDAERAMLLAKGSLFLGRMSQGSDGMSVLLERNPTGG